MQMRLYETKKYISDKEHISVMRHCALGHVRMHHHDYLELMYVVRGSGIHAINDNTFEIKPGTLCFINVGDAHSLNMTTETLYFDILINPVFFSEAFEGIHDFSVILGEMTKSKIKLQKGVNIPFYFMGNDARKAENILYALYNEFTGKKDGYLQIIYYYMNILMIKIARTAPANTTEKLDLDEMLKVVIEYVDENYQRGITLNDLSQKYNYNPSYFSRLFKKHYGINFSTYLQKKKLEYAIELLKDTNLTIDKVCEKAGFSNQKSFYSTFKNAMCITPSEFRRQSISAKRKPF